MADMKKSALRKQSRQTRREGRAPSLPVLPYTLLFALVSIIVFSWFFFTGRSFVRSGDGYDQHIRALAFYGKWLRQIVGQIAAEGRFAIPSWSFSIGLGADVITTLHYYVIGDPLNLLSVFAAQGQTVWLYGILILVRMYLAGLSFLYFCRCRNPKCHRTGILAGAVLYVFSAYTLFAGIRHPYFTNPMIWFPLILTGILRIRNEKRCGLYMLSVCMAALSNFYFFYMIVILTAGYVIWQLVFFRDGMEDGPVRCFARIAAASVIGLLMSCALFYPVVRVFLASSRGAVSDTFFPLYPVSYYAVLTGSFLGFFGPGEWTYLGYTSITVIALCVLFFRRGQRRPLKVLAVCLGLMLLFPAGGYLLNGFTYVLNRWTWAAALLCAWILVVVWDEMMEISRRENLAVFGVLLILALPVCFYVRNMRWNAAVQLLLGAAAAAALRAMKDRRLKKGCLLVLCCAGVSVNAYFAYSGSWGAYAKQFKRVKSLAGSRFDGAESEEAARLGGCEGDEGFFRYSGNDLTVNASLLSGTHSTQYYWSLANRYQEQFLSEMANREYLGYYYEGFDDRTFLNEIAGVRYFSTEDPDTLPYGYETVSLPGEETPADPQEEGPSARTGGEPEGAGSEKPQPGGAQAEESLTESPQPESSQPGRRLYENQLPLPLAFTCSQVIPQKEYEAMDPFQKQAALLNGVVLDLPADPDGALPVSDAAGAAPVREDGLVYQEWKIVPVSGDIQILDRAVHAGDEGAVIRIEFERTPNSETGLYIAGGLWQPDAGSEKKGLAERIRDRAWKRVKELTFRIDAIEDGQVPVSKELTVHTAAHEWYNGRRDFLVNGCWSRRGTQAFEITLPCGGTYSWEGLSIASQRMDAYPQKVQALRSGAVKDMDMHMDPGTGCTLQITMRLDAAKDEILFASVPYDPGWSAQVDGRKADILRADGMFMAIPVEAGEHTVILRYATAGGRTGLLLSLAGWILFFAVILSERKRLPFPDIRLLKGERKR